MRADVTRLSRWAGSSPESGVNSVGSLVAEVEVAEDGLARRYEIREGDEVLRDALSVLGSTEPPEFYPDDIPFIAGAIMGGGPEGYMWHDVSPSAADRIAGFQKGLLGLLADSRMREFAALTKDVVKRAPQSGESALEMIREGMERLSPREKERLKEKGSELFASTGAGSDTLAKVLDYPRERGWELKEEEAKGIVSAQYLATKAGERRRITANDMMGMGQVRITFVDDGAEQP